MVEEDTAAVADVWAAADLVTPMALRVAATLRIADHLAEGPRSADALAVSLHCDADLLDRLLRHLEVAGVVAADPAGRFCLTELGEPLRDDHPSRLRARLDEREPLGRADLSLTRLSYAVRTGAAAFDAMYGRSFWEDLEADSGRAAAFDAMMSADVRAEAPAIVEAYPWESLG